jgi:hypothetical protein
MNASRKTIPTIYGRAMRDIFTYHGSYKAEEWSSWICYYSPVLLYRRLPDELYQHYLKLVSAIELAIDYEITFDEVENMRKLIVEFVSQYEDFYYRYTSDRLPACVSTYHFLLHLADCILDCGPTWCYWQFPCERLCGMLKAKVKSRVSANRNLSLGILYEEQLNHLRFACNYDQNKQLRQSPHCYIDNDNYFGFAFLRPSQIRNNLSALEISHLSFLYSNLYGCSRADITNDEDFSPSIVKWGRCRLGDNGDLISSIWHESRRSMVVSSRQSSSVSYSIYVDIDVGIPRNKSRNETPTAMPRRQRLQIYYG